MILRRLLKILLKILGCLTLVVIYNEFIIYYVTLAQCNWPGTVRTDHVKAMIVADIHMLGPFRGHWADKLRREWQMHRAYQTSLTIFRPDVVFILGDLFDEGQWVDGKQFQEYVQRYRRLFYTDPQKTQVFGALGNHDIGFHYATSPRLINRFEHVFNNTDDTVLVTVRGVHFVLINSVRMEGDSCHLCREAVKKVENISSTLKCAQGLIECKNKDAIGAYSRPILLQHFPTYRPTDSNCLDSDSEEFEAFRERWEVLSIESTKWLGKMLNPRVAFSGHSHNYCRVKNLLNIEEYTISSYSWRNRNNPKFLLALFTPNDYHVAVCAMPKESTVFAIYTVGSVVSVLLVLYTEFRRPRTYEHYTKVQGKLS